MSRDEDGVPDLTGVQPEPCRQRVRQLVVSGRQDACEPFAPAVRACFERRRAELVRNDTLRSMRHGAPRALTGDDREAFVRAELGLQPAKRAAPGVSERVPVLEE